MHAYHAGKDQCEARYHGTEVAMKIISSGLAPMPVVSDSQEILGVVSENAILGTRFGKTRTWKTF